MITNLNVKVDDELKKNAAKLFDDLGLNVTTAVKMFLNQSILKQGIPFSVSKNNEVYPSMEEKEFFEFLHDKSKHI